MPRKTLSYSYDEQADVLYITLGKPEQATGDLDEDGLFYRYSMKDETPCGVTVLSFRRNWLANNMVGVLYERVFKFLGVDRCDIRVKICHNKPLASTNHARL